MASKRKSAHVHHFLISNELLVCLRIGEKIGVVWGRKYFTPCVLCNIEQLAMVTDYIDF